MFKWLHLTGVNCKTARRSFPVVEWMSLKVKQKYLCKYSILNEQHYVDWICNKKLTRIRIKTYYTLGAYINKFICIVSLRKIYLAYSGDRTTVPSLLVRALYRCDHQAVQKVSWISCYIQYNTLTSTGLGDIGFMLELLYKRVDFFSFLYMRRLMNYFIDLNFSIVSVFKHHRSKLV